MIILLKLSLLVILLLEKLIFYSGMSIRNIKLHISPPLVLILKSELSILIMLKLKCKSGILLDSKDLKLSLKLITKVLLGLYLFTPLPIEKLSKILKTGSKKSLKVNPKVFAKLLLVTSQTAEIKTDK
jgi:hypothetical protein